MERESQRGTAADARERKRARFDDAGAASNRTTSTYLVVGIGAVILLASAFFLLRGGGDAGTRVEKGPVAHVGNPSTNAARPAAGTPWVASAASASPIAPTGDAFRIPVADVSRQASFFAADVGGKRIPFFAVRDASDRIHVALDACQVCATAKKGYVQDGDQMTCRNCGQSFAIAQITEMGGKGGCHPISLPSTTAGDAVVVKQSDVAAGAKWF